MKRMKMIYNEFERSGQYLVTMGTGEEMEVKL